MRAGQVSTEPVGVSHARALRAAALALALVGLLGVLFLGMTGSVRAPQPARLSAAAGVASLPLAARGPVSAALGRENPAYWVRGFSAGNPAQDLRAGFSSGGVSVTSGQGRVRLSLIGFGRTGAVRPLGAAAPVARANRVVYPRPGLREWYANGPLGLEQGFDVARAPAGGAGRLVLSMSLAGNLSARVSGGDVLFSGHGASLRYAGLLATDARGRRLPASVRLTGGRLAVSVDDRGARYPLRVDPFVQDAELTPSDPTTQIALGYSSAVSGRTIAVAAPASTVGGHTGQGEIQVFTEPATGWANTSQAAVLTASDGAMSDDLGGSVAIDGSTIVAGAPEHSSGTGAAYVYVMPPSGWASTSAPTAELTFTSAAGGYLPVAISANTIVIGRKQQDAVDVFSMPTTGWASTSTPTAVLTASDGVSGHQFGLVLATDGSTIAVGAQIAGSGADSGIYVYDKPTTGWATTSQQTAELSTGVSTIFSGAAALAISGTTIAVGNPYAAVGTQSGQGAVYVFSEQTTGWANSPTPSAVLTASDGTTGDNLGFTVSASGSTIVAGAPGHATSQGAAYVYGEPATGWASTPTATQELTNTASQAGQLGYSVGFDGTTVVAGTRAHNEGAFVYQVPGTGGGGGGGGPTGPPVNTTGPVITGTPTAGKTLTCSTGTWTNAPTSFAYQWYRDGTPIQGATSSTYTVQKGDEELTITCTVTASNAKGAGSPATSAKGAAIAVPRVKGCPAATGKLSGGTLGLVRLGLTRAQARKKYTHSSNRHKKYEDFFCLTPVGVRVAYGSPALPKGERARLAGRVIWASTASAYYAVNGVRAGATVAAAGARLKLTAPFHIGLNTWYLAPNGASTAVLKTRLGLVEEVGVGDKRLTKGHKAQLAFLKSFS